MACFPYGGKVPFGGNGHGQGFGCNGMGRLVQTRFDTGEASMKKSIWKGWLLVLALVLVGWTGLVARYAPLASQGVRVQGVLLILLPAVWRDLQPKLPDAGRL